MTDSGAGIAIETVETTDQARDFAALVWAFFDHLRSRYPERADDIDAYLAAQDVAGQLADWRATLVPPSGLALLARLRGRPAGIVMLKRLGGGLCEMNRMYVTDAARGLGLGRALGAALIDRAAEMGFATMRLDAWDRHTEALPLYAALGFERVEADADAPVGLKHQIIHMRRAL